MLTVTDKASEVIEDFLKDKKAGASIHVFLNTGCSGPSLGWRWMKTGATRMK